MPEKVDSLQEISTDNPEIESGLVGMHENLTQQEKVEFYELQEKLIHGIPNPQEARRILEQLHQYADPVITIPEEALEEIEADGVLEAHKSWVPGLKILVGSIGMAPYEDTKNKPRKILRILPNVSIEPRFTGPDKAFHGVIHIKRDQLILGEDIEYLD